jgi:hypothetical protein
VRVSAGNHPAELEFVYRDDVRFRREIEDLFIEAELRGTKGPLRKAASLLTPNKVDRATHIRVLFRMAFAAEGLRLKRARRLRTFA